MKPSLLSAICLFAASIGYCAGIGGYSWSKVPYPISTFDSTVYYTIHAFDRNAVVAAGNYGIITVVNIASSTISTKYYGNQAFRWICFSDSIHGWVVGDGGAIYATADRGTTWIQQSSGFKNHFRSVMSPDGKNLWIAGDSGMILYSADDGRNWVRQNAIDLSAIPDSVKSANSGDVIDFVSVSFKDGTTGCVGGNWRLSRVPVIIMTCDGGVHWTAIDVYNGIGKDLFEAAYINEIPTFFIGEGGGPTDYRFLKKNCHV